MKALVTGGAGFIGSTLVDRLLADGWTVAAVDNLSSGKPANLEQARTSGKFSFYELDIRDEGLAAVVAEVSPDVVFHLAAQIDVRISVSDPALDAGINVIGTLNVLEAARQAGVRKVVFASSGGTIYGDVETGRIPVDETYPQHPVSPYGVSKKVATDYLFAYSVLHGLQFTSLALANVFGPRQDPHGEAGVVAIFAGRLLAGEQCKVFGDGGQTRDYVYVDDVVDAFAKAATVGDGELCNIGTGVETSVNDLYRTMADNAGVADDPEYAPARAGELARSALDAAKAGRVLGWAPQTDLRAGTANVLEWFRAQSA
jgi:UDP-glucose 4-epimerase